MSVRAVGHDPGGPFLQNSTTFCKYKTACDILSWKKDDREITDELRGLLDEDYGVSAYERENRDVRTETVNGKKYYGKMVGREEGKCEIRTREYRGWDTRRTRAWQYRKIA